jgi:hypothetical protein
MVLAIPLEIMALRAFSQVPFDFERPVKASGVELWTGMTAVILHCPARFILVELGRYPTLMWAVLFLIGYVDLLLVFGSLIALFKFFRPAAS